MPENTSYFNVFPVFFRGKTGGFGGMRGGHSLGKPRRMGKETVGGIFRQEPGDGNGGEGWQGIF